MAFGELKMGMFWTRPYSELDSYNYCLLDKSTATRPLSLCVSFRLVHNTINSFTDNALRQLCCKVKVRCETGPVVYNPFS